MARLNLYVPDEVAERARHAGLNVSTLAQVATLAELDHQATAAWLHALPWREAAHWAAFSTLDGDRGDFGSEH
jgi:post-segregation antitoxin (ccd killing protein)